MSLVRQKVCKQNPNKWITVQHVVKRYGQFVAVNDVSFTIREREIFGIIGPNGAGKTTTVECISGLRVPDSGSISVYGLSPQKDRNKIRKFVGVQLPGKRVASAHQGRRSSESLCFFLLKSIRIRSIYSIH